MKHFFMACCCLCSFFLCNTQVKAQAAGTLDASFGVGGVTVINNLPNQDINDGIPNTTAVYLQVDNKIIVTGYYRETGQDVKASTPFIARLNTNGAIDSDFGVNGLIVNSLNNYQYRPTSLQIQADGKILVAGYMWDITNSRTDYFIERYNTNGTRDNSFGINGQVRGRINISIYKEGRIRSLKLQADGKIVATGMIMDNTANYIVSLLAMRFNVNGSIDSSFGMNGFYLYTPYPTNFIGGAEGTSIDIDTNGRIVIVGFQSPEYYNQYLSNPIIMRLLPNGSLDNTFGTNGMVLTNLTNYRNLKYRKIRILSTGKLLTGLYAEDASTMLSRSELRRYNTNGVLDNTFGIDGIAKGRDTAYTCKSMTIQLDGKILTTGDSPIRIVSRFDANGAIDTSPGANGYLTIDASNEGNATDITVQSDNRIIIVGSVRNPIISLTYPCIVRILPSSLGVEEDNNILKKIIISPNPLQSNTQITYNLLKSAPVSIFMYNILGEKVANFITNSLREAGEHTETLSIPEMPSGIYLITINTPNGSKSIRVVKQ